MHVVAAGKPCVPATANNIKKLLVIDQLNTQTIIL
jgi:hypothetical protein